MELQGVVEPVEEVGYKNRPPLLEDVSIEGPTRTRIPHALDTLEQREAIEEDYNWWRYSGFAFPWLLIMLAIFATLFTMTAWEQVGDVRYLRDGVPTYFQLAEKRRLNGGYDGSPDQFEGGIRRDIRNLRISEVWLCFFGALLALLVLGLRPRPIPRKVAHYACAFIIFTGMVLCWASFGLGESDSKDAVRCPEMHLMTNERCEKVVGQALIAESLDFALAAVSLTAVVMLIYTTATGDFKILKAGWRQQERDLETEARKRNIHNIKAHHMQSTRMWMTLALLVIVILVAIAQAVLIVLLNQNHNTVQLRGYRGRTDRTFGRFSTLPFEEAGWSARNTRLRYSLTGIGILTILLNLIPWRSRVIAYIFAFLYLVVGGLAIAAFCVDVAELRDARFSFNCPRRWFSGITSDLPSFHLTSTRSLNCINSPYVACAIIDMFAAVACFVYVIGEYILRFRSVHSQRKYTWGEVSTVERELDSRRPVRCEITSEVMTAAEYYYRHRFLTEAEMLSQYQHDLPLGQAAHYQTVAYDQPPAAFIPPVGY